MRLRNTRSRLKCCNRVLMMRLKEQGKLEERLHEEEERIEGLENDKRESIRQRRELEAIYEAERAAGYEGEGGFSGSRRGASEHRTAAKGVALTEGSAAYIRRRGQIIEDR